MSNQPAGQLDGFQPEVEIMPGVYMSVPASRAGQPPRDLSELVNQSALAPSAPAGADDLEVMSAEEKAGLEAELLALEAQLESLRTRIATNNELVHAQQQQQPGAKCLTLAQRTGLTGSHLIEQIDLLIHQTTTHHNHLLSSQTQLQDLLVTGDQDIIDAFEENKAVLVDQLQRIAELQAERVAVLKSMGHSERSCALEATAQPPAAAAQSSSDTPAQSGGALDADDEKTAGEGPTANQGSEEASSSAAAGFWL